MSDRVRTFVFLAAAGGLGLILLGSLRGLPTFGRPLGTYGDLVNATAVPERHATNAVTTVNFDIRALDTLGEEFILFAAVAGVSLLLLSVGGNRNRRNPGGKPTGPLLAERGRAMVGTTDDRCHGSVRTLHRAPRPFNTRRGLSRGCGPGHSAAGLSDGRLQGVPPPRAETLARPGRGLGAGGYVLIGLACLLAGGAFLENVLPLGKTGALLSAGTIPLINLSVGLEVAAGFSLLSRNFSKKHARRNRGRSDERLVVWGGGLAGLDRPVRDRHQPQPDPPGHLPGGRAVGNVCPLLSLGYRVGGSAPIFADKPPGSPAVDPVVQALVLTDIVVGPR